MRSDRTLVEFYDHEHLENIISLLYGAYSDVLFVYFAHANEPDEEDRAILTRFVREKFGFSPRFLAVPEHTIPCALEHFRNLLRGDRTLDFDITGGSSVFIAAVGALLSQAAEGQVSIHEYDVASGHRRLRCPDFGADVLRQRPVPLSIRDGLALRGATVLDSEVSISPDPELDGLRELTLKLWDLVREDSKAWNTFCTLPTEITPLDRGYLVEKRLFPDKETTCAAVLDRLRGLGVIASRRRWSRDGEEWLSFELRTVPACLPLFDKGGTVLEMITYLAARDSGVFTDCATGVKLDWNGQRRDWGSDPYNEIDVLMTAGHIPYFASCKTTGGDKDFLYEILTMTHHFGGPYAVPMLISATATKPSFRTRAREMGVVLIDDVHAMPLRELTRRLQQVTARR